MMANLGVRAPPSFNARFAKPRRRVRNCVPGVQTGYDADTGQPPYEVEELEYEVLLQTT